MQIIELTQEHTSDYQSFFLRGLTQHSECFRISPRDAQQEPFPTKGTADSFTFAAVSEEDDWMGIVSFQREGQTREKLRHKGLLFRMYVAAEYGGQGVGQRLIEAVIQRVKALPNLEQINLTVIASNRRAKKLYEKLGFTTFSSERNAVKFEGQYFDEDQMVLFLRKPSI